MYINIEPSNAEFDLVPVTENELLPNVIYYFKLKIPAETYSPIVLKFNM